jgi:hypothetical protein
MFYMFQAVPSPIIRSSKTVFTVFQLLMMGGGNACNM